MPADLVIDKPDHLTMPSFATLLLIATALGLGWLCWALGQQVRLGRIVIVPMVAFTWLSLLTLIVIVLFGFSPLHLLWALPLNVLLALAVILSPLGVNITLNFLALLAGPKAQPPPTAKKTSRTKRKSRAKKR